MKNLMLIVVILCYSAGFAQQSIKGKVKTYIDKNESEPLFGADVFLLSAMIGSVSNEKGEFEIKGDVEFPDTLVFRASGYYSDTIFLEKKDLGKIIEVTLYPEYVTEEVVIRAKRDDSNILKLSPRNVESLNSGELRKAACCNLSESFETNATVDVSLSDGVSGSKRIQMMGLNGRYTQLQFENVPFMHNLDQAFGLGSVPGTWIQSIQITKGTGTVANGYESMAGLINLEYLKPDNIERLYVNVYGNVQGKFDINLHGGRELNEKWSSAWFLHWNSQLLENDRNDDGFRDMPIGDELVAMNRWKYKAPLFRTQFGVKAAYADKLGGQMGFDRYESKQNKYGVGIRNLTAEAFGKTGFLFENDEFSSLGIVYYVKYSELNSVFGNRSLQADETRGYINFMYETILGNTNHKLKTGGSFVYDDLQQAMSDVLPTDTTTRMLNRTELVPGLYAEYTYQGVLSTLVLGWRSDYHNLYGMQHSPRANFKRSITEDMDFRLTAGRGFRVSNYAADNLSLMATNTPWRLDEEINPEVSWNFGGSYFLEFEVFERKATWSVDFYHTLFENQLVADRDESTEYIVMKNLQGVSFSNAFQTDIKIEPLERFEVKAAYKYLDVRTTMGGRLAEKLMVPKHRGFLNMSYETRNTRWEYDATFSVFGARRLAQVELADGSLSEDNRSEIVPMLSGQVTHRFKKFEVYLGGENLLDYRLENPIINVENPFDKTFDATRVYAPIFGLNVYAGIRLSIDKKEK
jgi:outer membrane receptor for ferrienterochelin and colicin